MSRTGQGYSRTREETCVLNRLFIVIANSVVNLIENEVMMINK